MEFKYFVLFAVLLLFPKFLLRFRIPTALTALFLGFVTNFTLDWFSSDDLIGIMSKLGITSLFLFAGMEVDIDELKEDASVLIKHILKVSVLIFGLAFLISHFLEFGFRMSLVLSLGIMTPSTGFILNSLKNIELTEEQERWVRSKAISKELVALFILFFVLQIESLYTFSISSASLVAMVLFLPIIFKIFLQKIAPFAPDSEVSFLILIALLCGVITAELGAYYLVGAFVVGMTAGRFKHFIEHEKSQKILYSVSLFFSFFVPFYFYKAGMSFTPEMFTQRGMFFAGFLVLVVLPLRYASVMTSIWLFNENIKLWKDRVKIALPLMPTLIFGLVIMTILKEKFDAPPFILSGLLIYTLASSIFPWFFLDKMPPEEYDASMLR